MALACKARLVVGVGEHGGSEVGAPDRLAGGAARRERRVVDRVAGVGEQAGHSFGTQLAVRARLVQALEQARVAVVDAVAEDVEVLTPASTAEISVAGSRRIS